MNAPCADRNCSMSDDDERIIEMMDPGFKFDDELANTGLSRAADMESSSGTYEVREIFLAVYAARLRQKLKNANAQTS